MTGYCASGKRHVAALGNGGKPRENPEGAQTCAACGYTEDKVEVEQRKKRMAPFTGMAEKDVICPPGNLTPPSGRPPAPGPSLLCFSPEAHNALMEEAFRKGRDEGEKGMMLWFYQLTLDLAAEGDIEVMVAKAKEEGWSDRLVQALLSTSTPLLSAARMKKGMS